MKSGRRHSNTSRLTVFAPLWTGKTTCASLQLRAASGDTSNSPPVGALARLAPGTVDVSIYCELEELRRFSPEVDGDDAAVLVAIFRAALQAFDVVLISGPECADGVPGPWAASQDAVDVLDQ